jgi:hypothetical protein
MLNNPLTEELERIEANNGISKRTFFFKIGTLVSVIASIAVLYIAHTPLMSKIAGQMKSAMILGVDVDDSLGKSQFISNLMPDETHVSATQNAKCYSVVAENFAQTKRDGVLFETKENQQITSITGGIIIGNNGGTVEVMSNDGTTVIYDGCKDAPLGVGIRVEKGDVLATATSKGIKIKVFRSSVQTDPVSYIKKQEGRP